MKERTFRRQLMRRTATSILLVGLASAGLAPLAHAQTTQYSLGRRQIKACVLVSANMNGMQNATPHLWYVMDRREDVKPGGWEFVNPLAPSSITGDLYQRWATRGGTTDPAFQSMTPEAFIFQIGAQVTKNMAPYWEVDLDKITDDDLRQFDIAVITLKNKAVAFNPELRDRLRRFVDGGGTLWLEAEDSASSISDIAPFILPVNFNGSVTAGVRPTIAAQRHPILQTPFPISQFEAVNVGAVAGSHRAHLDPGGATVAAPYEMYPVLWSGRGGGRSPYVSAGDYGAGHLVVSSAGIATGVTAGVGGPGVEGYNTNVLSGSFTNGSAPIDLKIAYNIVSFGSNASTSAANARRTGATPDKVGNQLGTKWAALPGAAGGAAGTGAVVSKGIVYYVQTIGSQSFLRAYDLNPSTDLDRDGDGDDGIPDFRFGTPYDELWNTPLTPNIRFSTPTVVTYFDGGQTRDVVCITSSNGITLRYEGLPVDGNGRILTAGRQLNGESGAGGTGNILSDLGDFGSTTPMPSPAFSEGFLFSIGYNGSGSTESAEGWRLYVVNITNGSNAFANANAMLPPIISSGAPLPPRANNGIPAPLGSVSVGYVQDQSTGALDKIAYVATVPTVSEAPIDKQEGNVYGAWFATKGEPLTTADPVSRIDWTPYGSRKNYPWFPGNGDARLAPRVYGVQKDLAGNVTGTRIYTLGTDYNLVYAGSAGNRSMTVRFILPPQSGYELFADYTLDWTGDDPAGGAGMNKPTTQELRTLVRRMKMFTPAVTGTSPLSLPTGAPALSGLDTLIFANNFSDPTGSTDSLPPSRIFSVRDQIFNNQGQTTRTSGRRNGTRSNGTQVAWMFSPYSSLDAPGVPDFPIKTRLTSEGSDFSTASVSEPLQKFHAVGSPAVANGVVYVVGTAQNTRGRAITVILALKAEPTLSFSLGSAIGRDTQVLLRQPDLLAPSALVPRQITLRATGTDGNGDFTVDKSTGLVTIFNFKDGSANGGTPTLNAINLALPLQVGVQTPPAAMPTWTTLVDPLTGYGKLDNLLWYMALREIPFTLAEIATQKKNRMTDFNTQLTENDPTFLGVSGALGAPASGPSIAGEVLYFGTTDGRVASVDLNSMPSTGGAGSLFRGENLRLKFTRTLEDPLTGGIVTQPIFYPPQANASSLVVGTPRGLAALDSRLTIIADGGRLLEVDYGVNAITSISGTQSSTNGNGGTQPVVTNKIGLAHPTVARRARFNDYLIADTGNNRVVRTDASGLTIWELRTFNDGFRVANGAESLLAPTDVQVVEEGGGNRYRVRNPITGVIYESAPGPYYAVRYLIADSGNYRIIEVVDAYTPDGNPLVVVNPGDSTDTVTMQHQAVWSTRTLSDQSKRLHFRTVQEFSNPTLPNGASERDPLYLIASVDNVNTAVADIGSQAFGANGNESVSVGGSLVAFRRYRTDEVPTAPSRDGDLAVVINSIVYGDSTTRRIDRRQSLNQPTFFRQFTTKVSGVSESRYLLCDQSGAYVLKPVGSEAYVEWALTSEDYYRMTGRPLRASSIQKLPQSDYDTATNRFYPRYLITNQFSGSDNIKQYFTSVLGGSAANRNLLTDSELRGEVVEVRSRDYFQPGGYSNPDVALYRFGTSIGNFPLDMNTYGAMPGKPGSAIRWMCPKETFVFRGSGLARVQRIERKIGTEDASTFTFNLEQPAFSERQN